MAKTADPTRLVTPEHHVTVDDFLAVGLEVEIGFTANVEPQQGVLLDHNHLGVLIARQPTEVLFYPWSAIRRLSEAK